MPPSHDETPVRVTELPNPELNPLLNPTLGRHLGRWAQVYFTSPPEKREEAVGELLRELQNQPESEAGRTSTNTPSGWMSPAAPPREPLARCSECGQSYESPQRFCGMCGVPLTLNRQDEHPTKSPPASAGSSGVPEPPSASSRDFPGMMPVSATKPSADDGFSDVRWLREKQLTGDSSSLRLDRRYAPAALAFLAIGILFYAQFRPNGRYTAKSTSATAGRKTLAPTSQEVSAHDPTPPPATSPGNPAAWPGSTVSTPPPTDRNSNRLGEAPHSVAEQAVSIKSSPTTTETGRASQMGSTLSSANGSLELAQAEGFLTGKKYPRDSAVAARILWKAVGKENPTAILLLSDLYLVGDGVPKSCDQARLLLTAAARKGIPQAADKLRNLLRSGCR